jgi:chitin disaccharide deacetylase
MGRDHDVRAVTRLIVNADDLGYTEAVNRGILEAHEHGIVTGASLMVDRPGAGDGAARARGTGLSLGLHAVLDGVPADRAAAELDRQLARFVELVGTRPTHLDTHHHTHREDAYRDTFAAFAEREGLKARDLAVRHEPRFYGAAAVTVERLLEVLETLPDGDSELGCHPGYADGLSSTYTTERETELATLTDPRVRERVGALGIELIGWAEL